MSISASECGNPMLRILKRIVDCYLVACLEKDRQNVLYSYDRDFDRFDFHRVEP